MLTVGVPNLPETAQVGMTAYAFSPNSDTPDAIAAFDWIDFDTLDGIGDCI